MLRSLGDVRAENDAKMLDVAFFASPDYRTLIETDQKSIVVGRRGTGKSALFIKLGEHFSRQPKTAKVTVAPEEHEVLALKHTIRHFTEEFRTSRVILKLALKASILLEITRFLEHRYKFKNVESADYLRNRLQRLGGERLTVISRTRDFLRQISSARDPIPDILQITEVGQLEEAVVSALEELNVSVAVLFDRTDEGYDPDAIGAAVVDGIAHCVIELQDKLPRCRSILFLRDNIYRALAEGDPDFSRNIEQSVLRLHWDEDSLFTFICDRLKIVFGITAERSLKIWDAVSANGLKGKDGFRLCLRLTLYRPRDLLLLLNEAFRRADWVGGRLISEQEIASSAQSISINRLSDLDKEYSQHLPGLAVLISSFKGTKAEWSVDEITAHLRTLAGRPDLTPELLQHLRIFNDREILRSLFSIGFIGIKDPATGHFVFCHDGRNPDKALSSEDRILVHPCYWMALNIGTDGIDEAPAASIYDEYDVVVVSETPELRKQKIGQIEQRLNQIEPGQTDAPEFEQWCFEALRIIFAGTLTNIALRPNKSNLQRRDIVGTNLGGSPFWQRVKEDYQSRQVVFEVKNFSDLGAEEFRQVLSYTGQEYGKFAVIVSRDENINLRRDKELRWIRELRNQHGVVLLLINAQFICRILQKLRSPKKHDAADKQMNGLLDTYIRNYFGEAAVA